MTLDDEPGSQNAAEEPLPARARTDMIVEFTGTAEHPVWTLKDPLTLTFYQLRDVDYFVWQQLQTDVSASELRRRFARQFRPLRLSQQQLLLFIDQLWQQGLIILDRWGLSTDLCLRQQRRQKHSWWQTITGILAIRFRGVDPDRFLNACNPVIGWLFSPVAVLSGVVMMIAALLLVLSEWDLLYRELPRFETFLQGDRLLWIVLTVATVKVCHELGHAFVCKRFGGEVRELGLMLLVFTPCLYCNVSDAWLLRSRWQRLAISAAGIYVEFLLAALCTFVWWFSVPGIVHSVSLYVMLFSSLNTLLLNGNPLMRYDGYHILTDLVNTPNLRQRSGLAVHQFLERLLLGKRSVSTAHESLGTRLFLLLYGILSGLYLWVIVFAILWMLYRVALPWGAEPAVFLFGAMLIATRLGQLWRRSIYAVRMALWTRESKLNMKSLLQLSMSIALIGACVWWILGFPIQRTVRAPLLVEPVEQRSVFVTIPGRVVTTAETRNGMSVDVGDMLLRLRNPEVERETEQLRGQVERIRTKLTLLTSTQLQNAAALAEIPSTQKSLADYEQRLRQREQELAQLDLRAPIAGVVVTSLELPERAIPEESQPRWPALDVRNHQQWLEMGTEVCQIVTPHRVQAVMYVEQSHVPLIHPGARVRMAISQHSGSALTGHVLEVATKPIESLPPVLAASQRVPVEVSAAGQVGSAVPLHEVRVEFEQADWTHPIYQQLGTGVIELGKETVLARLHREISNTFHW